MQQTEDLLTEGESFIFTRTFFSLNYDQPEHLGQSPTSGEQGHTRL
jgi:hypothetical protein